MDMDEHSAQCSEITITLKCSEDKRKYSQSFLVYEDYSISQDDPLIRSCIVEALKSFIGDPDEIKIRINMEIV